MFASSLIAGVTGSSNPVSSPPVSASLTGPPILLDDGWRKIYTDGIIRLESILRSGLKGQFTNREYADLYTTIYQMCLQKPPHCYTAQLYEKYERVLDDYLSATVLPVILDAQRNSAGDPVRLLIEFHRRWEDHKIMRKWLFDFFKYLDRFYVRRHNKRPLQEVALVKFYEIVFKPTVSALTNALLEAIRKDRLGERAVDRSLLRELISVYPELAVDNQKIYHQDFEAPFVRATREFYSRESSEWIQHDSAPEYMRKCERRFVEEKQRLADFLLVVSERPLLEALNETLLVAHQREIIEKENTGVKAMLMANAVDDLARLFHLFSYVPSSLQPIAAIFQSHIAEIGGSIAAKFTQPESSNEFIEEYMKLHEKYFDLVKTAFGGNSTFQRSLKDAFEALLNQKVGAAQSSMAELLANYADNALKKGGTLKLTEKQLESTLDGIVRLFSYLTDKDLFAEFYRKQLATRLLTQRSASTDAEKSMIGKLKLRCGAQFTSKFEGMINDMRNAEEHAGEFKKFLVDRHALPGIEFSVQTLTTGFWPSYPAEELKISPLFQECIATFKVYYDSKTNNRKLTWLHDLGTVTLASFFPKKKVDLVLSTVQASILLLFNERSSYTIEELIDCTGLTKERMKEQLKTLVNGKYKLLNKVPSEGYNEKHAIQVNLAFQQPLLVLRIPNASLKTNAKDRSQATAVVSETRKHAMEAAIVRVMKSRKTLPHQQLILEVSSQLMQYFQPDPKQIKQRIEDLILREYLERDKEKSNVYHYLA